MRDAQRFYIDGTWVDPHGDRHLDVIDPATEEPIAAVALGGQGDVDRAVAAANRAFDTYSLTNREERLALLERIMDVYADHTDEMSATISREMGAPTWLAKRQAQVGYNHFEAIRDTLRDFKFEEDVGTTRVVREPVGTCGLITPWNWPMWLIGAKVAPALAAGCTMVLKPSEIAPLSALLFAEIIDEAGLPAGVFNLVNGDGPTTLTNRTTLDAFAARPTTLSTPEPSPLEPERLPKHVRYRCATTRRCSCVDRVQNGRSK